MLEHASIPVVERDGRDRAERGARPHHVDQLAQGNDVVMGGEPTHLPLEAVTRNVEARIADPVTVCRHDVVVTEDQPGVSQPAVDGRDAKRPDAAVVDRTPEAHHWKRAQRGYPSQDQERACPAVTFSRPTARATSVYKISW